jgi:hypothetical protein
MTPRQLQENRVHPLDFGIEGHAPVNAALGRSEPSSQYGLLLKSTTNPITL